MLTRCPGPTSIIHGVVGDPQPVFADTTLDSSPSSPFSLRHTPPLGVSTVHDDRSHYNDDPYSFSSLLAFSMSERSYIHNVLPVFNRYRCTDAKD